MWIVLTRSWNESWYSVHEDEEAARKLWKTNSHWYPNCWLIEGNVVEQKTYTDRPFGKVF